MKLGPAISYTKNGERLIDICRSTSGAIRLGKVHWQNGFEDVKIVTVDEQGNSIECDVCYEEAADIQIANRPGGHPDSALLACPSCRQYRGLDVV